MKNLLLCALLLAPVPPLSAQPPGIEQGSELLIVPPDDKFLRWEGHAGRTYFLQISIGSDPLVKWHWMPVIDSGTGVEISYEVDGTGPRGFYRLHYTDESCPPGVTLEDWDTDGDGRSNEEEVSGTPQSHPLKYSTSDTGIPDGWAVAHGLDPNDSTIGGFQFGETGVTNLQAFESGVQAHPNATPTNLDGDNSENDVDADPNDIEINWKPGPIPRFAVIELVVENPEQLHLDDLYEDGTILLSRKENSETTGRVVIDRHQAVHPFLAGNFPPEGEFAGFGPVLVEGKVPGFHYPAGSIGYADSLWDPVAGTFTPWSTPAGDHDNLRDERGGLTVLTNFLASEFIHYTPGGSRFPGDDPGGSLRARIEKTGNVVSERGYWRKNPSTGAFENRAQLPEETTVHSATLVEGQPANTLPKKWNLVAGKSGVLISENGGGFRKAAGEVGKVRIDAVTQQGWALDKANQQIRANGDWHALASLVGTPAPQEVEILEMLDTGLAVARITSVGEENEVKLALLLPVDVIIPQLDTSGNQIEGKFRSAATLKVAKWENAFEGDFNNGSVKEDFIGWDEDRFYISVPGGSDLGVEAAKIGTDGCQDSNYNDNPNFINLSPDGSDSISNSIILVSDEHDDDFPEAGAGIDDEPEDRTHKVQLGGFFIIKSLLVNGQEHEVNLRIHVPERKVLSVDFIRIDVEGVHSIPEIEEAVKIVNERYAQVGLRVDVTIK